MSGTPPGFRHVGALMFVGFLCRGGLVTSDARRQQAIRHRGESVAIKVTGERMQGSGAHSAWAAHESTQQQKQQQRKQVLSLLRLSSANLPPASLLALRASNLKDSS